jgi:hypothetical protein
LQIFLNVQASNFARLPDRSYRWVYSPQGSRDFYIRAEHASLPPHASDMLAIRIQAIDGMGTSTPLDSQPCWLLRPSRRYLCESFPGCLGPCHGGTAECTCLFLPPRHRPSPVHYRGRLPAFPRQNDFMTDRLFETAAIPLCSGPQVCLPLRSFLPLRPTVAEQPRRLHPSRTCFVTSACIGYANHPFQAIDGVGTYTPQDSQPCRLLQCNGDFTPRILWK